MWPKKHHSLGKRNIDVCDSCVKRDSYPWSSSSVLPSPCNFIDKGKWNSLHYTLSIFHHSLLGLESPVAFGNADVGRCAIDRILPELEKPDPSGAGTGTTTEIPSFIVSVTPPSEWAGGTTTPPGPTVVSWCMTAECCAHVIWNCKESASLHEHCLIL